jgi:hypothetical protein
MSGSRFNLDVPTFIRRMPPCGALILFIREFCGRVRSGELRWR